MNRAKTISISCGLAAVAFGLIAAGLGFIATGIEIPNNQDTFIDELARQGTWTKWAAICALIASVLAAIAALLQINDERSR